MSTFNAGAIEASLTLDRSSWNRDLKEIQAQILDLENKSISIAVSMDADEFYQGEAQVELMTEQIAAMSATIKVTMDADEFYQGEAQVELMTEQIGAMSASVGVETSGVPKVMAELAELEAAIEVVDGDDITVHVNYDKNTMEKLVGSGSGGGGLASMGSMGILQMLIIGAIALSPILGVAIGSLSAVIVAFGAALFAALGPLALIVGAIIILVKQFKAAEKAGKGLTPGMQLLAQQWSALKDVINGFVHSGAAEEFFRAMATGVGALIVVLRAVSPLMGILGGFVEEVANQIYRFVNSREFKTWIDFFGGFGLDMLAMFVKIGGSLIKMLINLFIAIAPFARRLMGGITQDLADLADKSDNLGKSKGFRDWIRNAKHYGPEILGMLGEIFKAFLHIGDAIRPFADPMIKALTDVAYEINQIPVGTLTKLIGYGVAFFAAWKGISLIAKGFGALSTAVEAISGAFGADAVAFGLPLAPLLLVVGAAAALAAMFIYLYKTNQHLRDEISQNWKQIQDTVKPIIADITDVIKSHWTDIQKWGDAVWADIKDTILSALTIIHQLVFFTMETITFIWKHDGDLILRLVIRLAHGIAQIFTGLFQILDGTMHLIADVLTGKWSHVGQDLLKITHGFWNIIVGLFRVGGALLAFIFHSAGRAIEAGWDATMSYVRGKWSDAQGWIKGQWDALVGWLSNLPGRVGHALSGLWDGLASGFRSAINSIINWWDNLSFGIPGFNPPGPGSFPGVTIHTPYIAPFAHGGYVDKPTIGLIGEGSEPEIVSPESMMADIVSRYSGKMDYDKMADSMRKVLAPLFGNQLTADMVDKILEKAGAKIDVHAENDDRSVNALVRALGFQMRVLGYAGATP